MISRQIVKSFCHAGVLSCHQTVVGLFLSSTSSTLAGGITSTSFEFVSSTAKVTSVKSHQMTRPDNDRTQPPMKKCVQEKLAKKIFYPCEASMHQSKISDGAWRSLFNNHSVSQVCPHHRPHMFWLSGW